MQKIFAILNPDNGGGPDVGNKIYGILLTILCLFLIGALIVMKMNEPWPQMRQDWLDLISPDGAYEVMVVSSRPDVIVPSASYYYELEVSCRRVGTKEREEPEKYYFSTRLGPIKHGLTNDHYEIDWRENGAILTFKNYQENLSFFLDFEGLFGGKNEGREKN